MLLLLGTEIYRKLTKEATEYINQVEANNHVYSKKLKKWGKLLC